MKKIAVTQRIISNDSYFEERETLDLRWGKLFKELNYIPIILPINIDFKKYFNSIDLSGIILTGGNDLSGFNQEDDDHSILRDKFEFEILKFSEKNDIPIYGICRGMHVIAKYYGSSFKAINNHVGVTHSIKPSKESKYNIELSKIKTVNSYHNFSINKIGKSLMVSAVGQDNSIEAIEHKKKKIFAQMWHSERKNPFDKNELELIKSFFEND